MSTIYVDKNGKVLPTVDLAIKYGAYCYEYSRKQMIFIYTRTGHNSWGQPKQYA